VRPALTEEDRLWELTAYYGWYAEAYQWTPDQVDNLPDWYAPRVRGYHEIVVQVQNEREAKAEKARAASQRGGR
jgi:hypothetical protein